MLLPGKNDYHENNFTLSFLENGADLELQLDQFITFFAAGQETTANSLTFAFMEIAKNSNVLEK